MSPSSYPLVSVPAASKENIRDSRVAEISATSPIADTATDGAAIQKTVIAIVSELTGYPEPMLGMDMNIESDLGIDSIKRVEILSAVEEKMPELPKVTPEMLGDLKTLGHICDYLTRSGDHQGHKTIAQHPSLPVWLEMSLPPSPALGYWIGGTKNSR